MCNTINTLRQDRNNVARTLFVAATNSLTQKSIAGLLNDLPYDGYVNLENLITDDENFYDDEINYNTGNIVYVTSKENVSRILDGYIMDTSVLNNAILIEYNIVTGKVLSVLYSDKVDAFGYGDGNFTDVSDRTKAAREEKKIGFYGARATGIPESEKTMKYIRNNSGASIIFVVIISVVFLLAGANSSKVCCRVPPSRIKPTSRPITMRSAAEV